MAPTRFTRWSGLAAILGGVFWITTIVITAIKPEHSRRGPDGFIALLLAGLLLIGLGAVGVSVQQRARAGRLGRVAVTLTLLGFALTILGRIAEDDQARLDVLLSLVKDTIARIAELEIRVAELEAQVGERTSDLDAQIAQLRGEAINPS
jgi:hypothetical protein